MNPTPHWPVTWDPRSLKDGTLRRMKKETRQRLALGRESGVGDGESGAHWSSQDRAGHVGEGGRGDAAGPRGPRRGSLLRPSGAATDLLAGGGCWQVPRGQ